MKKGIFLATVLLLVTTIIGCTNTLVTTTERSAPIGSLTITFGDSVSRNLTPTINMTPASFIITGTGPSNHTFTKTVNAGSPALIPDLFPGDWTITVDALNTSGTYIGTGSGNATISTATSSSVTITVAPYSGTGTLALALSWAVADVPSSSITATLNPIGTGTARTLGFTLGTGSATFTASDIPTGYYILGLNLNDSGKSVAGAVETVRIVKDQTTSGTYSFDKISQITGTLSLKVTIDMDPPLTVNIGGAAPSKAQNQTLTLIASTAATSATTSFAWYVNNTESGTGPSFSLGTTYAAGHYRIDVVAINSADNTAGSASLQLDVTAAAPFTEGLEYTLINRDSEYSVAKGTAVIDGLVVIPETYNGKKVTALAINAFYDCKTLTGITLPEGITSIGNQAFRLSALTSITLPSSVTSIGDSAFYSCNGLTNITLPVNVTTIGASAFQSCANLKSITIPQGVTSIGNNAFSVCSSLTSITIPQGVTSIGNDAFAYCSSLTSITIPEGVTSIGSSAFYNCSRLTSITIPEGVTSIGSGAFYNCSRLTSITIPSSVTTLQSSAFYGCSGLRTVTLPAHLTASSSYVFQNCPALTTVIISTETAPIGSTILSEMTGLSAIKVPATMVTPYKEATAWSAYINMISAQ